MEDYRLVETLNPPPFFLEKLLQYSRSAPDAKCCFFLDHSGQVISELTSSQWIQKAKQVAMGLKAQGVQTGDRVILALPTSEDILIAFMSLWWIGAIAVPTPEFLDGKIKVSHSERLKNIIQDCAPVGFIVVERNNLNLEHLEKFGIPIWDCLQLSNASHLNEDVEEPIDQTEENIALIQYTSGSTGPPKGVLVTQRCLRANIIAMQSPSQLSSSDRVLTWMPLYHDMGLIGGVFFPLYYQAQVYLLPTFAFIANPSVWLKCISLYQITISTAPNFAYNLCARRVHPESIAHLDLSSWRLAFNGAEPVQAETLNAFEEKFGSYGFSKTSFYPVYGMAEAVLGMSFPKIKKPYRVEQISRSSLIRERKALLVSLKNNDENEDSVSMVCVGESLPDHQIQIKNSETDEVLPERQVGEICFSGPSVTPGYYKDFKDSVFNSKQNEKSFLHRSRELKTGDLGYLANGNLFVVDRLKDLIKIAGNSYFPTDLETHVNSISGIRINRVIAFEHANLKMGTSSLIIVSEVEDYANLSQLNQEIRRLLHQTFGIIPKEIIFVEKKTIPLTSSGKLMRRYCRDLYLQGKLHLKIS